MDVHPLGKAESVRNVRIIQLTGQASDQVPAMLVFPVRRAPPDGNGYDDLGQRAVQHFPAGAGAARVEQLAGQCFQLRAGPDESLGGHATSRTG